MRIHVHQRQALIQLTNINAVCTSSQNPLEGFSLMRFLALWTRAYQPVNFGSRQL